MRIAAFGVLADGRFVDGNVFIDVFGFAHGFSSSLSLIFKLIANNELVKTPPAGTGGVLLRIR
jgi:hypothetical protein